jgi:hypothetical protein
MAATIQVPENLADRLQSMAQEEGIAVGDLIGRLVAEHDNRVHSRSEKLPISFKPIPREETGEVRSLTGAEIDQILADEDLRS